MAISEMPKTELDEQLEEKWADMPGVPGFLNTVDHKRIGVRYIYTSFAFFFIAGLLALGMRVQLAAPNSSVLSPQTYNEFFTLHGTTMIFLFNTPILAGFGNYLVPLMIGTRDMAFPRLNAFSYWIFLLGGIFLYASYFVGPVPDGRWFASVPLTDVSFSPVAHPDFCAPATGMVSQILPVFSGRPISGYIWVVAALVGVGFISFGVWVHHMFATGMPALALAFFSGVSLIVTLPSAIQFFAWIATMWRGKVVLTTPMLFGIGFLLIFLLGGITGVMVAMMPLDWQVHDSYFIVAHFHYVL